MKVSVIIPCYNQAVYLPDALESVRRQSYRDWECLIINDGSTDNTADIASYYQDMDRRFSHIQQVNGGLSNARNTGLGRAVGQFIQLLDADDLLERDKLRLAVDTYLSETLTDKVIVYSGMRYFEHLSPGELRVLGRDDFVAHIELRQEDCPESQQQVLRARNPFVISAPLYPAGLFSAAGCFDESLGALEDWDFHLRCIAAGYLFHYIYANDARTLIRLHDSSMMRNQKLLDDNFYKLIHKHNLREIIVPVKESKLKIFARAFTPPILAKVIKKIIKL